MESGTDYWSQRIDKPEFLGFIYNSEVGQETWRVTSADSWVQVMCKVQSEVQISVQTKEFRFCFDPLKIRGQGLSVLILFLRQALLHTGLIITEKFSLWIKKKSPDRLLRFVFAAWSASVAGSLDWLCWSRGLSPWILQALSASSILTWSINSPAM